MPTCKCLEEVISNNFQPKGGGESEKGAAAFASPFKRLTYLLETAARSPPAVQRWGHMYNITKGVQYKAIA